MKAIEPIQSQYMVLQHPGYIHGFQKVYIYHVYEICDEGVLGKIKHLFGQLQTVYGDMSGW